MSIAKAVYCYIFDLQARNSDHQKHNFMQFRDAFNRKSVRLTFNFYVKSRLYSEHNDLQLYILLKVEFCESKPLKK